MTSKRLERYRNLADKSLTMGPTEKAAILDLLARLEIAIEALKRIETLKADRSMVEPDDDPFSTFAYCDTTIEVCNSVAKETLKRINSDEEVK